MKTIKIICIMLLLFKGYGWTAESFNKSFIEAAKLAKPSVVSISIYKTFREDGEIKYKKTADGTGTIIRQDGLLVTNAHVVAKGNYFQIITSDDVVYDIEKVDGENYYLSDLKTDIAVLKIKKKHRDEVFEPILFGNANDLEEGEWVIAIGNPYGLRHSITGGMISSKGRDNIGFADIEDFIQCDVPINPGNSGGPLLNLQGEMVGLNSAIRSASGGYQGISFSIPVSIVKHVAHELVRYGKVRRGWMGFLAKENKLGSGEQAQIEVASVFKDSPAEGAGLLSGDIIQKVENKNITSTASLVSQIGQIPVGTSIMMQILRNGRPRNIEMVLQEKEEFYQIKNTLDNIINKYGISLDEDSKTAKIFITEVLPGPLSGNLKMGDAIVKINDRSCQSIEEFILAYNRGGKKINLLEIERGSKKYEIIINNQ